METLHAHTTTTATLSLAKIIETGMAFWASKTLLTAIKLELFTYLADKQLHAEEIRTSLGLDARSHLDFLDALVALGFLQREGIGLSAFYNNTPETCLYLDKNKPSYTGGILEMANDRLYPYWGNLEEALKTGKPQNELKNTSEPVFDVLYADPARLQLFMDGMAGAQIGNFIALAQKFPFEHYRSLCDIGGANAMLSVQVALKHPHLNITSVDLPPVSPIAKQNVERFGLSDIIKVANLDMMTEPFPQADIITMGNILHDWSLEEKKLLIRKAYEALPENGALVVVENIIDDERKENAFGLLMSLNMLIECPAGFDYSHADFHDWATEIGFRSTTKIHLEGPASAVVAYK
mgnify:CR=1 FL=1